jgi:nitrogen regulatory protein P-II 1
MHFRKITAIINRLALESVEAALRDIGVAGISVTAVKGFGEYKDFFRSDWTSSHVRVEVFASAKRAEAVTHTIMSAAHTGLPGDGLIAILPVEKLYRIRTEAAVDGDDV